MAEGGNVVEMQDDHVRVATDDVTSVVRGSSERACRKSSDVIDRCRDASGERHKAEGRSSSRSRKEKGRAGIVSDGYALLRKRWQGGRSEQREAWSRSRGRLAERADGGTVVTGNRAGELRVATF